MGQLEGRVAVVTGAGLGIGRAVAQRFVDEGARVVVAELDAAAGEAAAKELGSDAFFVRTDASKKEDVEAMVAKAVDRFGTLDILVNNAWGGGRIGRIEKKTPELMAHGLAIGFLGPFWAMLAAHPIMKKKGYGRIVNVCSLNGVNAHMGTAEYNTSKEALRAATRTAAREWAPLGITANIVCPAAKSASFNATMSAHPELVAAADASNPMGRIGDCYDDIAPIFVFLASEASRYLTGNTLFADGGSHINGSAWAPDLGDA
ncbi:MAG: SDR family oxidoreductase [Spirochaetaceae bacterium]|nr:SDR family oxidoreductase [Myxococcales bacterium]MCB9726262.1 SDR family oxidoreductase [Spirochaetaceae bacterium]HPG27685.1 SDR family oxidoreductase [Myxococcota bacterium]